MVVFGAECLHPEKRVSLPPSGRDFLHAIRHIAEARWRTALATCDAVLPRGFALVGIKKIRRGQISTLFLVGHLARLAFQLRERAKRAGEHVARGFLPAGGIVHRREAMVGGGCVISAIRGVEADLAGPHAAGCCGFSKADLAAVCLHLGAHASAVRAPRYRVCEGATQGLYQLFFHEWRSSVGPYLVRLGGNAPDFRMATRA